MRTNRFTGRQITTMVVAASIALVLLPVGAWAVTATVTTIADPSHPTHKARVTAQGRLAVTGCDSDSCAAVDSGKVRVGDGSGALSVDGTVRVAPPSARWYAFHAQTSAWFTIAGPTSKTINLDSLTVVASGGEVEIVANVVPDSVTTCEGLTLGADVWYGQAGSASQRGTLSVTFPTPLYVTPSSGTKACLFAHSTGFPDVSASGYYS
jgi:hypothetical protein